MRNRSQKSIFNIFAILLLLFIAAFINVWNNSMTDLQSDIGDQRWLVYTVYLLSAYSAWIWLSTGSSKFKGIHIVCLLWCIIMPIMIWINRGKLVVIFQTILWPLLFEVSFLLVKHDKNNLDAFRKLFYIVAIYGSYFFLQSRVEMLTNRHIQSNTIYFVFLTLPWLLLNKEKWLRLFVLILYSVLGFWSLKRSVMLTVVFVWAAYFLSTLKDERKKMLNLFLITSLIIGGIYAYSYGDNLLGGHLSERINREETDEGKNRLAIYRVTWEMIRSSSTEDIIFGHGHFGVRDDSELEISAHNDFMEVIYDYGIIIFVLYLCLWVYVFRRCLQLYRLKSELFIPYAASLAIFLVISMVAHLILYTSYFNYLVLFWGSIEAFFYHRQSNKKLK